MAGIVLKDSVGNPITYESVKHILVSNDSDGTTTYTDMKKIKLYYATMQEVSSGVYTFTIVSQWFAGSGAGYAYGEIDNEMCAEYGTPMGEGKYQLIVIFTHKALTTGKTYYQHELGGV